MFQRPGGSDSGTATSSPTPGDRFAALAFDFDGVVVDSPLTHLAAWQRAFEDVGLHVDETEILVREGGKDKDIAREIFSVYEWDGVDDALVAHVCQNKQAIFDETFRPRLISGIDSFIAELATRGYRLCLVSGTEARVVRRLLRDLSMDAAFGTLVTGDKLQRAKPDPEGYRLAATEIAVRPSRCLAVENSPPGIHAALAAGLACVALRSSLSASFLTEAEQSFDTVAELAGWFFGS